METDRRSALLLGAFAPLLLADATAPAGTPPPGPRNAARIFRLHAGPDGETHIDPVPIAASFKPLPVASVLFASFASGVEDWHNAPFKTFTINMAGRIEAQSSDGTKQAIGPGDLIYLEDVHGKGHITRLLTQGANLYLRMPDDFDVVAWAAG